MEIETQGEWDEVKNFVKTQSDLPKDQRSATDEQLEKLVVRLKVKQNEFGLSANTKDVAALAAPETRPSPNVPGMLSTRVGEEIRGGAESQTWIVRFVIPQAELTAADITTTLENLTK